LSYSQFIEEIGLCAVNLQKFRLSVKSYPRPAVANDPN
jgi:hypothetical protein